MSIPTDEPRWARRLYSVVAPIYDRFRPLWIARGSERDLDELLRASVGAETRVLELAPGTGRNLRRLIEIQRRFGSYVGVDVSPAMLRRAGRVARRDRRIVFLEADASSPESLDWTALRHGTDPDRAAPFGPPFDLVLSTWLLAHLDRPRDTVASALRLLAPGGTAIFLFFVEPRSGPRRWFVGLFVAMFRGRFVELDDLRRLPGCVEERSYPAAHLLVFRRTEN